MLYVTVVCLADLVSRVIICDLIRLGIMCLQEENNISPESTTFGALWKPHSCDLEVSSDLAWLESMPLTQTVSHHNI